MGKDERATNKTGQSAPGIGALTDVAVDQITENFVVPDYQRGYRWGRTEVTQLLDDVAGCTEERYYLQPIVVKMPVAESEWELVDGQQRLTTLYLIKRRLAALTARANEPAYRIRCAREGDRCRWSTVASR